MSRIKRVVGAVIRWIRGLPPLAVAGIAALLLVAVGVGGVAVFRVYTFVEHDNEFCMSCHLMQEPFERFARSAHRDLGCKACHQPTFMARTQMAVAQVVDQPEEITHHAEVPNAACARCHIDGDPENWRLIASSSGHQVHLESEEPNLQGLMCVECHSSSVHEFATTRQTCSQSGCHEDTEMRLAGMGHLTVHCVGCHAFSRPESDVFLGEIEVGLLEPRRDECVSCHEMRVLLTDFPPDEPHRSACGACHNPHEQATPRDAQQTCATAGCHTDPDTLTAMHRGLGPGVLEECAACHQAHDFRNVASDCITCHTDIHLDQPRPIRLRDNAAAVTRIPGRIAGWLQVTFASLRQQPRQEPPPTQQTLVFSHREHRDVECSDCHSSEESHGALVITSVRQCRECHHTGELAQSCGSCHSDQELLPRRYTVRETFQLSVSDPDERQLAFSHAEHRDNACADCHRQPLTLAVDRSCTSCHEDHHQPTVNCIACHTTPVDTAHTAVVHLGCAGSGCHDPVPFQGVPRTRSLCLSCHQDLVDHEPQGNCVDCHPLPRPRAAAASAAREPVSGQLGAGGRP
jgi:hypothetical protein